MKQNISPEQLNELRKDLGDKLFKKLSPEHRSFIINTSGSINLGKNVDIEAIYRDLDRYKSGEEV